MLKKTHRNVVAAPALMGLALALSACGTKTEQASPDQVADKLSQAADQSDPTSAAIIDRRADELRRQSSVAPADEAGSYAQDTMEEAGAASAQQTGTPAQ